MENLKETIAKHLEGKSYKFIVGDKVLTAKELAEHVRHETDLGRKFIEMAVKGTVERYAKRE